MISLKTHNAIDYLTGATVAAAPALFNMSGIPQAKTALMGLGVTQILYSLITAYSYSIAKWIPVKVHLGLDIALGALVTFSPWLFNYRGDLGSIQMAVHFVLGMAPIVLVAQTSRGDVPTTEIHETKRKEDPAATILGRRGV